MKNRWKVNTCKFCHISSIESLLYLLACPRATIKWATVMIGQSWDFSCLLTNFPGRIKKKHCAPRRQTLERKKLQKRGVPGLRKWPLMGKEKGRGRDVLDWYLSLVLFQVCLWTNCPQVYVWKIWKVSQFDCNGYVWVTGAKKGMNWVKSFGKSWK